MIYVASALLALCGTLFWVILRDTKKQGALEQANKELEVNSEAINDRPLSDSDLVARLRERAANERKNSCKS